jgi:hypothetical protein
VFGLLDRAKRRLGFAPLTLGADKGFFHTRALYRGEGGGGTAITL